jgi:hypothetical protein
MKIGMYIMTPESISTTYFTNLSHQFVCMYMYPLLSLLDKGSVKTLARQQTQQ